MKKTAVSSVVVVVVLLAVAVITEAQQAKKFPRIGFLSVRAGIESREEAFRQGLRELGHIEGQNVVIEWRFAKGKVDRFPEFAAELVRLKVDVIVVGGGSAAVPAKNATRTIPIVFTQRVIQLGVDSWQVWHALRKTSQVSASMLLG